MKPYWLAGLDQVTWGSCDDPEDYAPDLVGIHPRPKADDFSRCIAENSIRLFSRGLGRLTKGSPSLGRKVYYDSDVLKVTSWITCILASLLPIASILVLLNVPSLKGRLWVIAAFNILMSVCLRTFTEAKKSETFAITAAYVDPSQTCFFFGFVLTPVALLLSRWCLLERIVTPVLNERLSFDSGGRVLSFGLVTAISRDLHVFVSGPYWAGPGMKSVVFSENNIAKGLLLFNSVLTLDVTLAMCY